MAIKTITGKDVYEAMELNGFEILRSDWFRFGEDGMPVAACILGQAAINLKVSPNSEFDYDGSLVGALDNFSVPNDNKWFVVTPANTLYGVMGVGSTIIHHFDKSNSEDIYSAAEAYANSKAAYMDETWENAYNEYKSDHPVEYALTWKESLAMAKDLLTPIWDTKFEVEEYEFIRES